MWIFDRYVIWAFLKIFAICFFSFAGLFVVVDAFSNLEEFLKLGKQQNTFVVLLSYYMPRIFQFFDRMAPMIAMVAAIFAIARMQRSNELTAVSAGGVSNRRIVLPILLATTVLIALTVVNREVLIPRYRQNLAMKAQDLAVGKGRSIGMTIDQESGIAIRGKEVMPAVQKIQPPVFTLPASLSEHGTKIEAKEGEFLAADEQHPAGYLLTEVEAASRELPSQRLEGRPVIFRPRENNWLHPDQVFVATELDTVQLAFAKEMTRYSSLKQMIENGRSPSASFSNRHRVDIHWRIVQPFFDFSILLIGLPLVIVRGERKLIVSAGFCLIIVIAMVLTVIASQSMGAARIITPPSLAAWLPIILFVPLAVVAYLRLDR